MVAKHNVYSKFALSIIFRLYLMGKDEKIILTRTEYVDKKGSIQGCQSVQQTLTYNLYLYNSAITL